MMKKELVVLKRDIEQRRIVTVESAVKQTGLTREEVIDFIISYQLKLFDTREHVWYNESGAGHCGMRN